MSSLDDYFAHLMVATKWGVVRTNQVFFFCNSGVGWGGVYSPTFVYIHFWNTSYMHDDLDILVPGVLFSAGLGAFN